jgi:DNA-binding SARP family transcriptional activator
MDGRQDTCIRLCGVLEVTVGGRRVESALAGGQVRLLVTYLVLNRDRAVPRDELVAAVWDDHVPADPAAALRSLLSRVRGALGEDVLTGRHELRLVLPEGASVDVERARADLECARAAAARSDYADAAMSARAAAAALAERLLPGHDAAWIEEARRELADRRVDALRCLAESGLAIGGSELDAARRAAEAIVAAEPLHETGYRLWMESHARAGDLAAALQVYDRVRCVLRDELGTAPGPELQELHGRLLGGETTVPTRAGIPPPAVLLLRQRDLLVGRERELRRLEESLGSEGAGLVVVTGEPGVGKSMLAAHAALAAHEGGVAVLYGRCDEEATPALRPIVDAFSRYARLAPQRELRAVVRGLGPDVARILPALRYLLEGIDEPPALDREQELSRLFDAIESMLTRLAPAVLVIDDLQWADWLTMMLVRHLVRGLAGERVAILATARTVGADNRAAGLFADLGRERLLVRIELGGLQHGGDVGRLVAAVTGREPPASFSEAARRLTDGNPFFVSELARHVTAAVLADDRWPDVDTLEVPAGVRELISQRVARLSPPTPQVLRAGAVVGREFDAELLELLPELAEADVLDALEHAVAAGLLLETPTEVGRFAFAHALTRAAIVAEIPRLRRARLHRSIGRALEARPTDDPDVRAAELAHHFLAGAAAGDADRAVVHALDTADRAMHRLAFAEAGEVARRAAAVARHGGVDGHAALTAVVTAARALGEAGETDEARILLQAAATNAHGRHPDIESYAKIEDTFTKLWDASSEEWQEMVRIRPGALAVLEERGNHVALARAHELAAFEPWGRCQFHAAELALKRAERHARRAGDSRVRGEILGWLGGALVWGPCPVHDALVQCGRMLDDAEGDPTVLAGLLYARGALEAMAGDIERARASCASGAALLEDLRLTLKRALFSQRAAVVERLAGDAAAAERELRWGYDLLAERGEGAFLASRAADLASVVLAQARDDEAEQLLEVAERGAPSDDPGTQMLCRSTRAVLCARRGDHDSAARLAREAIAVSEGTDSFNGRGAVLMDQAEVLRLAGLVEKAAGCSREATAFFEAKGNLAAVRLARDALVSRTSR